MAVLLLVAGPVGAKATLTESTGPEGFWVTGFTYDVPNGTWVEGANTYHYEFEWTEPTSGFREGVPVVFTVSSDAPLYPGFVLLRVVYLNALIPDGHGLRCEPILSFTIHPDQATRFVVGWVNDEPMTSRESRAHIESMTATAVWDDGSVVAPLVAHHTFRQTEQSPAWPRYVCSWAVRP